MKLKQTILAIVLIIGLSAIFLVSPVNAQKSCGGVDTSIIDCDEPGGTDVKSTGIWGVLMLVLNILTTGVGVAAVGGIAYGSVLYASAGGNADQVKTARDIIKNTVIGLLAWAFMFSFLNWLVPGGLFSP